MRLSHALAGLMAVFLICTGPVESIALEPPPPEAPRAADLPAPEPSPAVNLAEDLSALRDDVGALWNQLDRLTDGEEGPRWAQAEHDRLDRRLERMTRMLEGLSARVETPVPRLDEPFTLVTVSLCMLVLGLLAGRSLARRGRKDSRFRL